MYFPSLNRILVFILVGVNIFSASYCYAPKPDVPTFLEPANIYHDKITLSGFSSGGTFAQMLQFSYSSMFSGIAVFSHTYYRCGPPNGVVDDYDRVCTKLFNLTESQLYDPNLVHNDIRNYARRGIIEDTKYLRNKRLYVYAGLRNVLFTPRQSLSIVSVYEPYIGSSETIFTRIQDSNLVMPTDNRLFGGSCTEVSEQQFFIGRCDFSGVTEAINFLLFPYLNSTSEAFRRHNTPRRSVSTFDQREFTRGIQNHNMDDFGYYYIPAACKKDYYNNNRRCYLHLYFHGCLSGRHLANKTHVENTGLLELADRKGIILVFPQARPSLPQNEIGCWDTFGVTGPDYATQRGPQIKAVKAMLDRLRGHTRPQQSSASSSSINFSPSYPSSASSNYIVKGNGGNRRNGNYGYNKQQQHRYSSMFNSKNRYGRQQQQSY